MSETLKIETRVDTLPGGGFEVAYCCWTDDMQIASPWKHWGFYRTAESAFAVARRIHQQVEAQRSAVAAEIGRHGREG